MELSLAEFVWLILAGAGGLVLVLAVVSRTLHARTEAKSRAHRVVCRLCLHTWVDEGREHVVHCPECGAANERGRSRRLG